ncbi:MAG: L-aspartate oxidase [Woeseiaceae bacterium]|nr:L-aspartate oxidase [Woeseiaceae bacterium]
MNATDVSVRHDDVVVVGSGLGGLVAALSLAPASVTLVTKTARPEGGSSLWAQGGIAAAVGPGDTPADHAADTVAAGAGLSDAARARQLAEAGVQALDWLIAQGVPFDRDAAGQLLFGREAAHGRPRVVHAGGDATGAVLMDALTRRAAATPSIGIFEDTFAAELVVEDGRVAGVLSHSARSGWVLHAAPVVIVATGGIGMSWSHTTNPVEATGDGLAMAARAGAVLADLEFVQFHPTALAAPGGGANLPLLTEALRGAGATLVDETGTRFLARLHPAAELAPRDVVAAAIHGHLADGHDVFLDIRPVLAGPEREHFPTAVRYAREAGFDPEAEPLPVVPAAHYHMGGIAIDERGRTSLPGLWACGEVATTGIHGANRLASNSLLEALVFARNVAVDVMHQPRRRVEIAAPELPSLPRPGSAGAIAAIASRVRETMSSRVGIVRDGDGLGRALAELAVLATELDALGEPGTLREQGGGRGRAPRPQEYAGLVRAYGEARNRVVAGQLVALAALNRQESRGAHRRRDFPAAADAWRHSQPLTIASLSALN